MTLLFSVLTTDKQDGILAEKIGFKTHSAVGKRLTKLKQKFTEA